jgi:hypothetical protein
MELLKDTQIVVAGSQSWVTSAPHSFGVGTWVGARVGWREGDLEGARLGSIVGPVDGFVVG